MNVTSDSQRLTRSVSENVVSTTDLKSVKDRIRQLRTNGASTTTQSKRKTDTV